MTPQPLPLSASVDMAAAPDRVWSVLSDVTRMPDFSPELVRVVRLGRRRGLGQRFLGINRRKLVLWPTTSTVVRWEPERAIAWHTHEPNATWSYEIEPYDVEGVAGSRVTVRRELPGFSLASKLMTPILGGASGHDHELDDGIRQTLERIRVAVEA